ncbi:bZIP transcription factor 17-like [Pistacia vera]|uniref:bZIP transcription factor 17-like n=1 Tax=Pistacia vera TaxID=55513 RepID=UPI001263148D|nr:bZIP transcription factor 17-like [Pistacia vera]XP_031287804.1 bZIP transcription factor 17-like [Pistacia vera]
MADPLLTEPPPPNPNFSDDFNSLPIPPLDPMFFSAQNHTSSSSDDLDFVLEDNCDFDISFDDLDNLYFPSESDNFFLPDGHFGRSTSDVDRVTCLKNADTSPDEVKLSVTASPESGSSAISGSRQLLDVEMYLNYSTSPQNSGNQSSNSDSKCCEPLSSQGSGNFGSGVSSGNSLSPDSGNLVVEQKIKVEEVNKSISKRKKNIEETNSELRSSKYHRSSLADENSNENMNEEDMKRKARLMRNRESAQLSRQRKKHYVEELEDKVRAMHSTIAELNGKISFFMAENASLRQQLSSGSAMPPPPQGHPHMGVYPPPHMAAMPYAWMPCGTPYMVKPQGSQTPLVPIPRLKTNQTSSPAKAKKNDSCKTSSKTKKVASVSFLGLLFFVLLFGGLVPLVDVKYGGMRDGASGGYFSSRFYDQHRGRVLTVNGHLNGSHEDRRIGFSNGKFDIGNRVHCERGVEKKERGSQASPGSDEFVNLGNASEPLVASLYVPRNDKLVKIDGNLIIHSVLASEKTKASQEASRESSKVDNRRETGLALAKALAIPDRGSGGRHSNVYRNPAERQKAISSGSADALKDHMKSTAADRRLQQWFQEGLAGPLLSSGMCTEVFQFDVSPASASGAIIPASSVANISVEDRQNATHVNKGKNRRILHGLPVPFTGSDLNISREHVERKSQDRFQGNKSASSMIVSVLVDPREAGDGDVDSTINPKSLSRIFVVVLMDSVKYVTYSCVLPRFGTHLVTT